MGIIGNPAVRSRHLTQEIRVETIGVGLRNERRDRCLADTKDISVPTLGHEIEMYANLNVWYKRTNGSPATKQRFDMSY